MSVKACGLSDVGQSRSHNEDCFAIDADHGLFLVADGMGGHGHGEVASQLAVEAIRNAMLQNDARSGGGNSPSAEGIQPHAARLAAAFRVAHDSVVHAMREDSTLLGMGTTAVGCAIHDEIAAFAHVGDSRAYRLRDDELELVTEDHTWVNEQVMAGYLSADQARSHPLKSVVTRAIGGDREIAVDLREIEVRDGDLYPALQRRSEHHAERPGHPRLSGGRRIPGRDLPPAGRCRQRTWRSGQHNRPGLGDRDLLGKAG